MHENGTDRNGQVQANFLEAREGCSCHACAAPIPNLTGKLLYLLTNLKTREKNTKRGGVHTYTIKLEVWKKKKTLKSTGAHIWPLCQVPGRKLLNPLEFPESQEYLL